MCYFRKPKLNVKAACTGKYLSIKFVLMFSASSHHGGHSKGYGHKGFDHKGYGGHQKGYGGHKKEYSYGYSKGYSKG